jgi:hypothetical protein
MSTIRTSPVILLVLLTVAWFGLSFDAPATALPREGDVRFKVTCGFDHAAADDPIVHPDMPGMAHLHNFFGKRGVTASTTTYASLVDGDDRTTCNDPQDLASYWTPAVSTVTERSVTPTRMTAYYRRGSKAGTIQAYPDGLKIVAGWASGRPQPPADVAGWQCGTGQFTVAPPTACADGMTLMVRFPDCWDGVHLDSADHRSHMAYSSGGDGRDVANVCPATHPVQVPQLTTYTHFDSIKLGATITGLSSGGTNTIHADFFNGWVRSRLQERIDTCLNGLQRCESGG